MRLRGLTVVASVTAALAIAPPAAPAPPADGGPYRVQMLYRTGTSLAPFTVTIEAGSDNDLGMWFAVELHRRNGRWIERPGMGFGGYHEWGGTYYPHAYGRPATTALPACPGQPGCTWPVKFDGSIGWTAKPAPTSRYYFVTAHADATVKFTAPGWRLKDVPSPGFRRIFADQSNTVGARSGYTIEHFTSATARGGRYGSSVSGYVPCETTGYGTARLSGRGARENDDGIPMHDLECEPHRSYNWIYAYTPYETVWRLNGDVYGIGTETARLVVFDYPKP